MGCFLCGHLDHLGQEKGSCVVFSIGLLKPNGHHDFTLMHTEPAIFKKNRFTAYKTKVTIGYSQRVMSYNLFRCLIWAHIIDLGLLFCKGFWANYSGLRLTSEQWHPQHFNSRSMVLLKLEIAKLRNLVPGSLTLYSTYLAKQAKRLKLFGITYFVGKISRSNCFFQGPEIAEWVKVMWIVSVRGNFPHR